MEMKLAKKEQKSILAKLLATENLTVEHGKYQTASFDVKNRVLRLPIWKDMEGSLYDLLVLHEVGHALFTPEEGYHDAKGHGRNFKSFLNVVEDARIERKIKVKFPGGRRAFVDGYNDLMNRDFFGIKEHGLDVNELNLIDRINLHYKAGDHLNISFSDEEKVFLDRIDRAETWKTVVKICKDLYEYSKDNESETDMSDHSMSEMSYEDYEDDSDEDFTEENLEENEDTSSIEMPSMNSDENSEEDSEDSEESGGSGGNGEKESEEDSTDMNSDGTSDGEESNKENSEGGSGMEGGTDGDFDPDYEPESITDNNFRNNENDLISEDAKSYRYLNLPTNISLNEVIVDFKELHTMYRKYYIGSGEGRYDEEHLNESLNTASATFKEFRNKNKKVVEYLAKEFEMKKAARDYKRAATANSGILDSEKLYTYKYNEHVFKKLTVIPDGKNHGLVMFVDWSGSMSHNMKGTIDQMITLVMFCKRVNIPFEVYAFSDSYYRYREDDTKFSAVPYDERDLWDTYLRPADGVVKYGDLAIPRFSLLNLFSSRMRAKDLHEAYIHMTATSMHYDGRYQYGSYRSHVPIPNRMCLGGTPLDSTLMMSFPVMREFIKRNHVDVVNSIFLTDGDSHSNSNYWNGKGFDTSHFDVHSENVVLRDPISKKSIQVGGGRRTRGSVTRTLVKFSREVFNINIVNFFLVGKMRKWDMVNLIDELKREKGETTNTDWDETEIALKKFRKDKYFVAPEASGFNEQYMILGGKNLEVSEHKLEVAEDASPAQLARAFKSFSKGKLEKRKLLSRFIDMVAV